MPRASPHRHTFRQSFYIRAFSHYKFVYQKSFWQDVGAKAVTLSLCDKQKRKSSDNLNSVPFHYMLFAQSNASLSCCASWLFAILLCVMLVIIISGCCLFHVVAYVVLSLCFESPLLCLFVRFYARWSQSGHGELFHRPHQGSCPNPTRQSTIFIILVV